MLSGMRLIQLGDLALTVPTAAALTASLMASRAWRMAFWWSLLFLAGIGLVGASKIAFLGWGTGWAAICFKAASGHAAGVTAVFPTLFYLLMQGRSSAARHAAIGAGLGLGALVALSLVALREHSAAEAVAGWLIGAVASLAAIRLAGVLPPMRPLPSAVSFALVFIAAAWLMESAHVGYWMIKAARLLSGNQRVFPLSLD